MLAFTRSLLENSRPLRYILEYDFGVSLQSQTIFIYHWRWMLKAKHADRWPIHLHVFSKLVQHNRFLMNRVCIVCHYIALYCNARLSVSVVWHATWCRWISVVILQSPTCWPSWPWLQLKYRSTYCIDSAVYYSFLLFIISNSLVKNKKKNTQLAGVNVLHIAV